MALEITVSPEFGWKINEQHVYGPGSVFQGCVSIKNNSIHNPITQIKLKFSSMEAIVPYTISPGVIRASRKLVFSVSKILKVNDTPTTAKSEYNIPFTVQIPMIQFPPSVKQPYYQCEYKLTATAAGSTDVAVLPIVYMPLIETTLLKSPMVMSINSKDIVANIKLYTLNFVPGDDLNASIEINTLTEKKPMTLIMEVQQNTNFLAFDDVPDQVKIVGSKTLDMTDCCRADMNLSLPADLTPSFVGSLVSVSYTLNVRVEFKGLFSNIWKSSTKIVNAQIVIGTLGYGIRSSNELKNYSVWFGASSMGNDPMPLPIFMDTVEYEDALPVYESSSLPCYELGTLSRYGSNIHCNLV